MKGLRVWGWVPKEIKIFNDFRYFSKTIKCTRKKMVNLTNMLSACIISMF